MSFGDSLSLPVAQPAAIRSRKVSELLAKQLVEEIIDQRLPEGAALLPERAMIEQYGLGRSTVREALRLLETRGVLDIRQGIQGGPVVRKPRPSDLSESLSLVLAFSGATLDHLVTARYSLEPVCTVLAADNITGDDVAEMRDSIEIMRRNIENQSLFRSQSERFHSVILRASHNPVLYTLINSIRGISDHMTEQIDYTRRRRHVIMRAHTDIVAALEAGDAAAAETHMREHLDEARRFWKRSYGALVQQPVTWLV